MAIKKINTDLQIEAGLLDGDGNSGTANQILISTGTGVDWVDGSGSGIIGGPYLPLTGGTMTGTNGVIFPDNFNLKIGTGSDLQIYHDGSDSYIDDTGTGWLRLRGNGGVILSSYSEGETMLQATRNGAVSLYYDNSKKFETTSTGVSVTGQTVSSAAFISNAVDTGNPQATTDQLRVSGYGVMGNRGALYFTNASGGGNLQFGIGGGHASNTQLTITNAASTFAGTIAVQGTGDSYFTGNVGIGTTSPSAKLHVNGSWVLDGITGGYFGNYTLGTQLDISELNSGGWARSNKIVTSDTSGNVFFGVLGNDTTLTRSYWTIGDPSVINATGYDSGNGIILLKNGNVGIGTASPAVQLELGDNTADEKLRLTGAASGKPLMTFYNTTTKIGQIASNSVGMSFTSLGSGDMSFSNGTGVLVIENGGNVGIGTTIPSYKLDVDGEGRFGDNGGILLTDDSGTSYVRALNNHLNLRTTRDADDIYFSTGTTTTTKMFIQGDTGNVGIGTTGPSYKLDVDGVIRGEQYLRLRDTAGTNRFSIRAESTYGTIDNGTNTLNYNANNHLFLVGLSEKMRINSSGNVGIGTTNPTSQLGSTKVLDISSTGNGEIILDHTDAGVSSDIGLYSWNRNNDHLAHIKATCDGATDSAFISFHTQATGGSFVNAASNEKMRIKSNGNVGIGTSTPLYLLDAAGTIRCTSLIQTSQSDKKENIGNIDKSKPKAIPFKEYRYKSDIDSTGRKRYGVLAEDIENDYPELVYVDSNGDKAVNYIDLLVKRVAELEKELEDISLTPGPKGDTGGTGATGSAGANGINGKDGVNGNDHLKNVQSITFNERTGQLEITIEGYKDPFKFNPDK
jgi:hypothetical protein